MDEKEKNGTETATALVPIQTISLGAGVQSSTMALMAAAGEITPMPDCSVFADTQAEPGSVYKWLDWLEKQLPYPVHRVTAEAIRVDKEYRRLKAQCGMESVPFLHDSRIPLDEVDFSTDVDRGQTVMAFDQASPHFGNDCEGMCGV